MNIIATVGRNSRIVRKAKIAAALIAKMEGNNLSHAKKEADRIKTAKAEGRVWHNTPRIQA